MASIPRCDSSSLRAIVQGKVAMVTGAARGIGFATASLLATSGARVILVDVSEQALKDACAEIGRNGNTACWKQCDVSDWDSQLNLFDWAVNTLGSIDIVVCNAAVNPEIALLQTHDVEKKRQMSGMANHYYLADEKDGPGLTRPSTRLFEININSVVFGLKLAIHHMKKQQAGGRIVVVGSAGSYVPVASQPLYTASKHAVLGLVRSTALIEEVAQAGVAIALVAPWLTLTSMVEGLEETTSPDTLKSTPEDVAWAIAHAASAPAAEVNGKGFWIQGQEISEVEGAYGRLAGELISPLNRF